MTGARMPLANTQQLHSEVQKQASAAYCKWGIWRDLADS
jgi:hypothetical protein